MPKMPAGTEFSYVIDTGLEWASLPVKRPSTHTIVIHHAGGSGHTLAGIHKLHLNNGHKGIDYNYFIARNGAVYRGRGLEYEGGHVNNSTTGNLNRYSIGICLDGNVNERELLSAERESLFRLVTDILKHYPTITKIIAHNAVKATICPGKNMPVAELQKLLKASATQEPESQPEQGPEVESDLPVTYQYTGSTYINIRMSPVSGRVIGKVCKSEKVLVTAQNEGWLQLVYGDKKDGYIIGWSSAQYFRRET